MRNAFLILIIITSLGFPSTQLSLDQFLHLVGENNRDLELAGEDLKISRVYQSEARSTALPKIMMEGSYTRNLTKMKMYIDGSFLGDSTGGTIGLPIGYNHDYGVNAVLNQSLFDFNAFYARRASKEFTKLSNEVYRASNQAIFTFSKKAYYQTLLALKIYELNDETEQNSKANMESAKMKYEAGQISELEFLQAEIRYENQIPATLQSLRNYQMALNNLKSMAGLDQSDELTLAGDFTHIPEQPDEIAAEAVLENQPAYLAQNWETLLRTTNLKSKYAAFLPTLSANAIWSFSGSSNQLKVENDNNIFMVGLNLSVPIYMGGYSSAQVSKAKIELRKSRLIQAQAKEQINIELQNIYLRLEETRSRIAAANGTLATAEKAFTIAESMAETGLTTQLQLKDARVGYDQARLNYYLAVYEYLDAYYDFELATGNVSTDR